MDVVWVHAVVALVHFVSVTAPACRFSGGNFREEPRSMLLASPEKVWLRGHTSEIDCKMGFLHFLLAPPGPGRGADMMKNF